MSEIKYRPHLDRIAKTKSGLVRGAAGNCPIYTVYRGIPYAKPPVGELRWKEPEAAEKWSGVRVCALSVRDEHGRTSARGHI